MLFRLIFHMFRYIDNDLITFIYFTGNDLAVCGFATLIYSIRDKINISFLTKKRSKRLFLTVLIYSLWCLIVDTLILMGIGTHGTALYTSIDITILSIGAIWASFA